MADDFGEAEKKSGFHMYVADEMGYVRVFELDELFEKADIKPVDLKYREDRKCPHKIETVLATPDDLSYNRHPQVDFKDFNEEKRTPSYIAASSVPPKPYFKDFAVKQVNILLTPALLIRYVIDTAMEGSY